MKILRYLLVVVLGAIGVLSLLRGIERLVFGGGQGSAWVQVFVGLLFLLGAWRSLKSARA